MNFYRTLATQDGNYAGMMGSHENDVDNNRGNYGVGYVVRDYKWLPPFEQESDVDKIISTWRSERDCYPTRMLPKKYI